NEISDSDSEIKLESQPTSLPQSNLNSDTEDSENEVKKSDAPVEQNPEILGNLEKKFSVPEDHSSPVQEDVFFDESSVDYTKFRRVDKLFLKLVTYLSQKGLILHQYNF